MTNALSLRLRLILGAIIVILAAPFLAVIGWLAHHSVANLDSPAIDDAGTGFLVLMLAIAAIVVVGFVGILVVGGIYALIERHLPEFVAWRARITAEAAARITKAEHERIAAELHATQATRQLLEVWLADVRVRAQADRDSWTNLARDQLQPLADPGRNIGIFECYATASTYHRMLVREGYGRLIELAHPRHDYHMALLIADLPPPARLLYLPVAIDATDGPLGFDRLDFDLTDHTRRRYVYRSNRQVPDFAHWQSALPAIEAYLGGRWRLDRGPSATVVLTALPDIPEAFPLEPAMLRPGHLTLGRDLNTGTTVAVPFNQMSHTLVAGPTGMGKSVLLHQLMASVVTNLDAFEAVYLVDLKFGLELQDYAGLHPKFHLTSTHAEIAPLVATLLAEMERRGLHLQATRRRDWNGPLILVVIDEFADMLLGEPDKKKRDALETALVRLTNITRALGFRFWVQTQKSTVDALPAAIRINLQSVVSFRMVTNQAAATLFGGTDNLPADITTLRPGQAIYRDGRTSTTVALQAALVTFEDVERLSNL